jgi:hypothetical protein
VVPPLRWSVAARGQQPGTPVVGYLDPTSPGPARAREGFREGLSATGFVEGKNLSIEARLAELSHTSSKQILSRDNSRISDGTLNIASRNGCRANPSER